MQILRKILIIVVAAVSIVATPDALAKKKQGGNPQQTTKTSNPRTSKQVRQEKEKNAQEIERARKQLADNTKQTRHQLNRLSSLDAEVLSHSVAIDGLKLRLDSIKAEISSLSDTISRLDDNVATLRVGYAENLRMMRTRRQSTSNLAFIFSSGSFTEAYKRLRYLKELNSWNADKTNTLKASLAELGEKRRKLVELQDAQKTTLSRMLLMQTDLKNKQVETATLVADLKREGKSLNKVIAEKQKQAQALDRELDRIIAEEARKAEEARLAEVRRKAEEAKKAEEARKAAEAKALAEARKTAKPSEKGKQEKAEKAEKKTTPAAKAKSESGYTDVADAGRALTGSFRQNKGKLLFPVAGRYSIVSNFGTNTHPELSAVKVNNSGIDIEVPKGSSARAVFDGVVSSVFRLEGYHNIVIVRHGEYLTVYAGIDALNVKKGDKVSTNQPLGQIFSDPEDGNRTVLHFEIRREKEKLNPLEWIR